MGPESSCKAWVPSCTMGSAWPGPMAIVIALALDSLAVATPLTEPPKTSQSTGEVRFPPPWDSNCRPDRKHEHLVYPTSVVFINFYDADSVCKSLECLDRHALECLVTGWIDVETPQVLCTDERLPPNYEFSHAAVKCRSERGCLVKNSCTIEYKLRKVGRGDFWILLAIMIVSGLYYCFCCGGRDRLCNGLLHLCGKKLRKARRRRFRAQSKEVLMSSDRSEPRRGDELYAC